MKEIIKVWFDPKDNYYRCYVNGIEVDMALKVTVSDNWPNPSTFKGKTTVELNAHCEVVNECPQLKENVK